MTEPVTHQGGEPLPLASQHRIADLEVLRTIADPLRLRLFEELVNGPQTVKAVASRLGLAPSRLYYHVNLLEEAGLIRVVRERLVGNLVEKLYQSVARRLEIAPDLLSFRERGGRENIASLAVSSLDATREDLLRSLDARRDALSRGAPEHPRSIVVTRRTARIPDSVAEVLEARVVQLLQDFEAARVESADDQGGHEYALAIAFYPQFDYEESQDA